MQRAVSCQDKLTDRARHTASQQWGEPIVQALILYVGIFPPLEDICHLHILVNKHLHH